MTRSGFAYRDERGLRASIGRHTQPEESPVKERPILFSGPMVRGLLDDRKTQTRRIVKPQGWDAIEPSEKYPGEFVPWKDGEACKSLVCPYGAPGDRLWVREAHSLPVRPVPYGPVYYEADNRFFLNMVFTRDRRRPSIHMPRWASRITLRVTDVRVERLNDISMEDAAAEGWPAELEHIHPVPWYATLWDKINGPGSWDANPWVWAVTFEQVRA